jgi:hypothetical protein
VELPADAVADELAHERVPGALGDVLDRAGDVADVVARPDGSMPASSAAFVVLIRRCARG